MSVEDGVLARQRKRQRGLKARRSLANSRSGKVSSKGRVRGGGGGGGQRRKGWLGEKEKDLLSLEKWTEFCQVGTANLTGGRPCILH